MEMGSSLNMLMADSNTCDGNALAAGAVVVAEAGVDHSLSTTGGAGGGGGGEGGADVCVNGIVVSSRGSGDVVASNRSREGLVLSVGVLVRTGAVAASWSCCRLGADSDRSKGALDMCW